MRLKRAIAAFTAAASTAALFTAPAPASAQTGGKFDPQNTLWTDNFVEDALNENSTTKYSDIADVNPNASSKTDSGHINPYGTGNLTDWAYSEYLWTYSYPVGNGRMAAMVAGGIDREVIQINEDTIWDGSPYGTLIDDGGNVIDNTAKTRTTDTITVSDNDNITLVQRRNKCVFI